MILEQEEILKRDHIFIIILIFLSLFLFFFRLGYPTLWDKDEAMYGEVAREVVEFGNWTDLTFNYQPWFEKPPLYIWLTALAFKIFGVNEFSVRFWTAIFSLGGVIVTFFIGKWLFRSKTGFLAGIVLATNFQYIIQARMGMLDAGLTFFVALTLLFFILGYKTKEPIYYYLFFVSAAGGVLTKGPVGLALPILIVVPYLIVIKPKIDFRQGAYLRLKEIALGIVIFIAIVSPWFIIQSLRYGGEYAGITFIYNTFVRYTTSIIEPQPFYYYLPVLILGFFPWSAFLPYSLVYLRPGRMREVGEREEALFILLWFAITFLFFSIAKTRLSNHILPLYPAIALMVGKVWDDIIARVVLTPFRKGMIASFSILAFLVLAMIIAIIYALSLVKFPAEYRSSLIPIILTLAGGTILALISYFSRERTLVAFTIIAAMMSIMIWSLAIYLLPRVETVKPSKYLSDKINMHLKPEEGIACYHFFEPSWVFYTRHRVEGLTDKEGLISFLNSEDRVYCVMYESDYKKLRDEGELPLHLMATKAGRVLISNKGARSTD